MDQLTSNRRIKQESVSLKTNSSILETYFAVKKLRNKRAELCFPNSISDCDKLSTKSVYRPRTERGKIQRKKRPKSIAKESQTSIDNSHLKNEVKNSSSSFSYNKEDERQIKLLNYEVESKPLEIKYSWQDLENWIPPSAKNKLQEEKKRKKEEKEEEEEDDGEGKFACEIKYSWQIIGISSQTSDTLLEDIDFDWNERECEIKYSWQIIGIQTQACLDDSTSHGESDYWEGKILKSQCSKNIPSSHITDGLYKKNRSRLMCNESIQTSADKCLQTDFTDSRVKYSWQNLTKAYLDNNEFL